MSRFFFLLWACFAALQTQGQVSFTADTDAKQIPQGATFQLRFKLSNAQGSAFTPPPFGDFSVAGGPNRMNSMTMVNGSVTSSETWSYILIAKNPGVFTIRPATVKVNGKIIGSNYLTVEVTKAKPAVVTPEETVKGNPKDVVFIRAEVDRHEARVGQQIILDYKLYTRASLNGVNLLHESDYTGFYKQEINSFNRAESQVTLGGKRYVVKTISRAALFPQQEGTLTVDPLSIQAGVVKNPNSGDTFDDLFNMPAVQTINIASNPVVVQVRPLQPNPPASFTGAVGAYEMQDSVSRREATTDDAVSLRLTVRGNGDPKRVVAPPLPPVEGLEIYDPKIVSEHSDEEQGQIITTKEIEYLIIPKKSGSYVLRPEFTYFSVADGRYVTLNPNTFNLSITQGSAKAATLNAAERPKSAEDIRFLKTATRFTQKGVHFFGSPLFWALTAGPFLLVGAAAAYRVWRTRMRLRDVGVVRSRGASKAAQRRLSVAKDLMKNNQPRPFYDEISKTFYGYVADKLNIPRPELSKSTTLEKLQSLGVSDARSAAFMAVLQECELALFAGKDNPAGMTEVYQKALKALADADREVKK